VAGRRGATYYKSELSPTDTFVPVEETYFTYNTSLTPASTFTHGLHYWRVSGVDADGHVGAASDTWSFTKNIAAPPLVNPGVNATINVPTMQWTAVDGAAYYKIELSAHDSFIPVLATYTTYNLSITPVDLLATGVYYWRVSGVDADGHVGNNNWRRFTLNALPAGTDLVPQLGQPGHGTTIYTDPTFTWSLVANAGYYHLIVSKYADFHASYDTVYCDHNSYTPYTYNAGDHSDYPPGVYHWKVEALNQNGYVITTSAAWDFTIDWPEKLFMPLVLRGG
jgi:hypothetical protein